MIDKNTIVSVTNRDNGNVGYTIPDLGINRTYHPGETKKITMDELYKLSYLPGGMILLKDLLIVDNPEALAEVLNQNVEPEYYYTEADVKELLLNGSLDQLKDCLDFAPEGVIDLIKDFAVKLEINDIAKRDTISEKTGFNITRAIEINHESQTTASDESSTIGRRAEPIKGTSIRRTSPPE